MGYSFHIGNAEPSHDKSYFPDLEARWIVAGASHPDAPTFPNDEITGRGNARHPSYTVWSDFCQSLGITDVFYDDRSRLHAGHPGCIGITQEMVDKVSQGLERYRVAASLPPGFEDWTYDGPPRYDYHLARGIWLQWWMKWALENCETPAIQNT